MAPTPVNGGGDSTRYPPHVLREYSFVGDGERGALIGPRGEIAWMCAPRWDSGSVFGRLIDARGMYAVTPRGRFVWGGYYEPDSLIWRSRWVLEGGGIVECREALAMPADPHRLVLLRRIQPVKNTAELAVHLEPAADYGATRTTDVRIVSGSWVARLGNLRLRWSGAAGATFDDAGCWHHAVQLCPGEHLDLVLELSDRLLPDGPPDPDALWERTKQAWHESVPDLGSSLAPAEARHAYAVLRGMTSRGGGMVAAATTSLPERADTGRSYDYRYVWVRDQSFAGQAVARAGSYPLLDDAVGFLTERVLADGPKLAPAYTTSGEPVPDQKHLQVRGYPGGADVIGNHVTSQFQLDGFGEALLLFATAERLERLSPDSRRAGELAAAAIAERWQEPDAGIWELGPQVWTHSRLIAAAGLKAFATSTSTSTADGYRRLADRMITETTARTLRPDGAWSRAVDDGRLDGALLLPGLRGTVPAQDRRVRATLDGYLRELTVDQYGYRFPPDGEPLGKDEGAFLLCGFLTAMALHQQGRLIEAARWFERTRASAGPPQLFSEEFDATQHQLRGNLPQAFVHAFLIEAASRLTEEPESQRGASG